jgi:hypothetical protein
MTPNSYKKEYKGVVQDPSTNNNTKTTITRKESNNAKKITIAQKTLYLK